MSASFRIFANVLCEVVYFKYTKYQHFETITLCRGQSCNGTAKRESRANRELSRNCKHAADGRKKAIGEVAPEKVSASRRQARRPAPNSFRQCFRV